MCVLAAAPERTARAEGGTDTPAPRHVEITLVAPTEDRALENVLSELLARLQVTSRFSNVTDIDSEQMWAPHPGAPAAIARVWIDFRDPSQITLYLTGDRQNRVLIRQVPLVRSLDEVAREEVAHIVEATVDELLLGGQIGVEKKHPAPLPKIELSPPLPEPVASLDIGLGYETQVWNGEPFSVLHGPAAFVGVVKRSGRFRPGLWFSGELRFAQTIEREGVPVSARLEQGALRLLLVADRGLSSRWTVRGGVGGGVDLVDFAPSSEAGARAARNKFIAIPMVRAVALARFAFTTKSEGFFGAALDVDLFGTHYVVQRQDLTVQSVTNPWQFRPMALIGVASDVLAY